MRRIAPLSLLFALILCSGVSAADPKPADALKQQLERPSFSGSLSKVLDALSEKADVPIVVDWVSLADAGVTKKDKVSIKASKAAIGDLLEMALVQAARRGVPLAAVADRRAVIVTTQARAIARRNAGLPPAPTRARRSAKRRPARRRARPTPIRKFEFKEIALEDVIQFIRDAGDLNIHVNWKALMAVGVDKKTAITLKARGISLGKALNLVLDQAAANRDKLDSLYWVIDEGVVMISTGTDLNTKMRTRVFEVADLLHVVPNFSGPRIDLEDDERDTSDDLEGTAIGGGLFGDDDDDDDEDWSLPELRKKVREDLIAAVKQTLGDDFWRPNGTGSIKIHGTKMIITQSLLGWKLMQQR